MENRISSAEERALTRAIEKAATIASVNESLDRNVVLAEQLKASAVNPRFAKVASQAFNKRLTVLTFQKTADDQRHLPFGLSDPAVVESMVGGTQAQTKQASLSDNNFVMRFEARNDIMAKSASTTCVQRNYEDSVDYTVLHRHIESMLDKHAATISILSGEIESLDSRVKEATGRIAEYFQKSACGSFEFNTLINHYGNAFIDAVKDHLPESTDYTKTAASAVLPTTGIYKEVSKLIKDRDTLTEKRAFLQYYANGVSQFCKAAGMFGDYIADTEYRGIHKQAAGLAAASGNAIRGITLSGLGVLSALNTVRNATNEAVVNNLSNAKQLYDKSRKDSVPAGEMLDSEFLIKDRFRDRMLSWSDMSADPQFSMYPAEQVFNATQKAMDADTSLERPDMREALRTQVAQLLAQNNRYSTADIAALSTIIKDKIKSTGSGAAVADAIVRDTASQTTAPEVLTLENPAGYTAESNTDKLIESLQTDIKQVTEQARKDREAAKDRETKALEAAKDREAKALEAAAKERQAIADKADALRQKRLDLAIKLVKLDPMTYSTVSEALPYIDAKLTQ